MEIRRVPVSKLNPAAYNPRKDLQSGDAEYQKLARSLDQFGCVEPVVWNERTGNVVGGHQRLKILLAAGETELDVSVVNLSDADEKALNIALNKIEGEWDTAALTELLQELSADSSIDETLTGFDGRELDNLLANLEGGHKGWTVRALIRMWTASLRAECRRRSRQNRRPRQTGRRPRGPTAGTSSYLGCLRIA